MSRAASNSALRSLRLCSLSAPAIDWFCGPDLPAASSFLLHAGQIFLELFFVGLVGEILLRKFFQLLSDLKLSRSPSVLAFS